MLSVIFLQHAARQKFMKSEPRGGSAASAPRCAARSRPEVSSAASATGRRFLLSRRRSGGTRSTPCSGARRPRICSPASGERVLHGGRLRLRAPTPGAATALQFFFVNGRRSPRDHAVRVEQPTATICHRRFPACVLYLTLGFAGGRQRPPEEAGGALFLVEKVFDRSTPPCAPRCRRRAAAALRILPSPRRVRCGTGFLQEHDRRGAARETAAPCPRRSAAGRRRRPSASRSAEALPPREARAADGGARGYAHHRRGRSRQPAHPRRSSRRRGPSRKNARRAVDRREPRHYILARRRALLLIDKHACHARIKLTGARRLGPQ